MENVEKGKIKLNGKLISSKEKHVEPEDRNVSLAFQDNSLFPHYTVEKNILLGAERNNTKKKKKLTFNEIIDLLDISKILKKYPHEISAGESQRASLARSLLTQPDLLLLDEPLSNVDQSFKEEIQVRLKKIESRIGTLSKPSKMPSYAWGIPIEYCVTGSKLAKVKGTICNKCYAGKGCYVFPVVKDMYEKRYQAIELPEWIDYMAELITQKYKNKKEADRYHRWFDSGDIQSYSHLMQIVAVCELPPYI